MKSYLILYKKLHNTLKILFANKGEKVIADLKIQNDSNAFFYLIYLLFRNSSIVKSFSDFSIAIGLVVLPETE